MVICLLAKYPHLCIFLDCKCHTFYSRTVISKFEPFSYSSLGYFGELWVCIESHICSVKSGYFGELKLCTESCICSLFQSIFITLVCLMPEMFIGLSLSSALWSWKVILSEGVFICYVLAGQQLITASGQSVCIWKITKTYSIITKYNQYLNKFAIS